MRVSVIALPLVAVSAVATQHVPRSQHLKRVQALQERQDILDVLDPLSLFSRTSTQPTPTPPVTTPGPSVTSSRPPVVNPGTSVSSSTTSSSLVSSSVAPTSSSAPVSVPPSSSSSVSSVAPTSSESIAEETSASSSEEPSSTSASLSVNAEGQTVTMVVTATPTVDAGAVSAGSGNKSESISTGAIIGIVVGVAAAVLAVIAVVVFALRRRRHNDEEAIRWPELNRHGDSDAAPALPARRTGQHGIDTPSDRRMSLGSDLEGPTYGSSEHNGTALNGSDFGGGVMLHDIPYDEKRPAYDQQVYEHDDFTSYPPAIRPQPSPVHGVQYDWDDQAGYMDQQYGGADPSYPPMHRQDSPPMAGVGAGGGGVSYQHHY